MRRCRSEADDKEPEIRHADAVGGVLQRFFHLDADAQFVEGPLKFGADRGRNLARGDLDRLERRKTGPDGADDQIERVREDVEKRRW